MTQTAITLLDLFKQTPPDYSAIDEIMSKTSFSSDELTFLASEIIIDCDCDDPRLTGEPSKIKYDKLTYLYKSLEYLFSKGLDPNHEYDVYSPLSDFQYITTPGMGPKCMKLFLDHGANPDFLGEGEAET